MDARTIATLWGVGRIVAGSSLVARPGPVSELWAGRDGGGTASHLLAPAMGVRDAGLGAGLIAAVRRGEDARPWMLASLAGDAVDLAVTLRGGGVPLRARIGVGVMAGGSIALGGWLLGQLD